MDKLKNMNVLSLFDGISCGQLALHRCGIDIDNYYASEIDKFAISITQYNFPNTIQLGDVNNWKDWDIDWNSIDLLIGGSPCFVGNTLITMSDGSQKRIDEIVVGDEVKSYNIKTQKIETKKVLWTGKTKDTNDLVRLYTNVINGIEEELICTPEHKIYTTNRGYVEAKDIKHNDELITYYGPVIEYIGFNGINLSNPDDINNSVPVYDITVEDNHNFFANTILVHNCQSFSVAGKMEGFDGESGLFYKYLEVLNHLKEVNPNVKFLLENVKMKKEWQDIITNLVGVEPVLINAALVSAQNRNRLYWCNWDVDVNKIIDLGKHLKDIVEDDTFINKGGIRGRRLNKEGHREDYNKEGTELIQCLEVAKNTITKSNCVTTVQKDNVLSDLEPGRYIDAYGKYKRNWRYLSVKECERLQTLPDDYTKYGLVLKDIVEDNVDEKYYIDKEYINYNEEKQPICMIKDGSYEFGRRVMNPNLKSYTLTTKDRKTLDSDNRVRKLTPIEFERLQTLPDDYTKYGLVLKDIVEPTEDKEKYNITKQMFAKKEGTLSYKKAWSAVRTLDEKSKTLTTSQAIANSGATNVKYNDDEYYKLTPIESERLQTLPDDYTKYGTNNSEIKLISDNQRYKTVGNGWCCKVIEFLFSELIENNK